MLRLLTIYTFNNLFTIYNLYDENVCKNLRQLVKIEIKQNSKSTDFYLIICWSVSCIGWVRVILIFIVEPGQLSHAT